MTANSLSRRRAQKNLCVRKQDSECDGNNAHTDTHGGLTDAETPVRKPEFSGTQLQTSALASVCKVCQKLRCGRLQRQQMKNGESAQIVLNSPPSVSNYVLSFSAAVRVCMRTSSTAGDHNRCRQFWIPPTFTLLNRTWLPASVCLPLWILVNYHQTEKKISFIPVSAVCFQMRQAS